MAKIIGRRSQIATLNRLKESKRSEFLALYGRRRVGKTYLIREYFESNFAFHLTGIANATTAQQLFNFDLQLKRFSKKEYAPSKNWLEAFFNLENYLSTLDSTEKKVIFLDELPWLDNKNADFISGLEHFWNSWADAQGNILLIVCGSAASWMLNNLIHNRGGLHNRLTERMKIHPFNLSETAEFLENKGCLFTPTQVVLLYMTMGGIPYYLEAVPKGKSVPQVVQQLFFDKQAPLRDEFKQLYRALFKKHEVYEKVVQLLATKNSGFKRTEIVKNSDFNSGGTISKVLMELEESGFITSYISIDAKIKNKLYRLSDFYTNFYFRFIANGNSYDENYWINIQNQPQYNSWKGIAFESVCLMHADEIKKALGISGIVSRQSTWIGTAEEEKAQIDFLIDRQDQVITICECKFSSDDFVIDKAYAAQLRRKIAVFKRATNTKKTVFLTFISSYGLQKNEYAFELVQDSFDISIFF